MPRTNPAADRSSARRPGRQLLVFLALVGLIAAMLPASPGGANHDGTISGVFESADGNLRVDHQNSTAVDWNSFTGEGDDDEAPDFNPLISEWNFARFEDDTGNPDDIFSGGVKQDDDCASYRQGSLGGGSSKFDLSDIYLANKTIGGDEYLFLAWVRVPSSPSASSHIAYEFNKGTLGNCPGGSDLLRRVEGDMLVVYDFEGGDADSTVKLARWLTAAGGHDKADCETAKNLPCWGTPEELTALGFADAKVNNPTDVGPVLDDHREESLQPVRFGEAGINLTAAGVFNGDECEQFGSALAVSRSSGNSGIAQMKDKVGPEDFTLTNCGTITIEKQDDAGEPLVGSRFTLFHDDAPTGGVWRDPTRLWPTADATEQTELDGPIDDTETTVAVDDASIFAADDHVFVGAEAMRITTIASNDLTVDRAQLGTEAGFHDDEAIVSLAVPGEDVAATTGDSGELKVAITDAAATITLKEDHGGRFPTGQFVVQIDDELILVTRAADSDTLSVVTGGRGYAGTTAAGHAADAEVQRVQSCAPVLAGDPAKATCTLTEVFFGTYWVVETTTPVGYTTADPQAVDLTEENDSRTLTFVNNRAPVDITVVKEDDTGGPVPICFDDGTDVIDDGCAEFELHGRPNTSLAGAVDDDESTTTITVADASIFTVLDTIVVHGANLSNAEVMTITSINNDDLDVTRTDRANHADGAVVSLLSGANVADCEAADVDDANDGVCTFDNIVPGDYWIIESTHPLGYGEDPTLPRAITINLGDTNTQHVYTFVNPRLFNVIVLVCRAGVNTLVGSDVTFDDEGPEQSLSAAPGDLTEAQLCGLGGARFENKEAGTYDDDNVVTIPSPPPPEP